MSGESTKKASEPVEPGDSSVEAMPELTHERFRRRPGRGHHVERSVGGIVAIETDLWRHFGSARAVNEALRRIVDESRES